MKNHKPSSNEIPYRNRNHTDWWFASYIIRFEIESENQNDLRRKCLAWKNSILIKAKNREAAYKKAIKIGKFNATNDDSTRVRKFGKMNRGFWVFEGLTSLLPIYEEIEDGCEILWSEYRNLSVKRIKAKIREKKELECFIDNE